MVKEKADTKISCPYSPDLYGGYICVLGEVGRMIAKMACCNCKNFNICNILNISKPAESITSPSMPAGFGNLGGGSSIAEIANSQTDTDDTDDISDNFTVKMKKFANFVVNGSCGFWLTAFNSANPVKSFAYPNLHADHSRGG